MILTRDSITTNFQDLVLAAELAESPLCGKRPTSLQCLNQIKRMRLRIVDLILSLCYPSQVNVKRIVHGTIYSRVTPYLSDWQHEFLSWGCSCVTQLVLSHHHWIKALDDGSQVPLQEKG